MPPAWFVENRIDSKGVPFYAVACDLCTWWDDENNTPEEAEELGRSHVAAKHCPELVRGET